MKEDYIPTVNVPDTIKKAVEQYVLWCLENPNSPESRMEILPELLKVTFKI